MVAEALDTLRAVLPSGVSLVAVSKFHPAERLMEAYAAGQRIFAESRPQELSSKVPLMPADVQWHFIGHLQTNKLKLVLPYVSLVQSVDSLHLLEAIAAWGIANNRTVDVLLELHLGAEETKQGFSEPEILDILSAVAAYSKEEMVLPTVAPRPLPSSMGPSLLCGRGWPQVGKTISSLKQGVRFRGLMGMATNTDDQAVIEADFARIEHLFLQIRSLYPQLEAFDQLSIGMSADWPLAVRHGATMVRIGTDIFGPREY